MALMLSSKSVLTPEADVRNIKAQNKSATHVALEHGQLLDIAYGELSRRGIKHGEGEFGVSPDGERMFGLLELEELTVPSVEARARLFRDTELTPQDRHHMWVRMVEHGALKETQLLAVEKEYNRELGDGGGEILRDWHSLNHTGWRLMQAYTHVLQRGGKFKTENARLEAIRERTQIASRLLEKYCDPQGAKMKQMIEEPELFNDVTELSKSYRYVLGIRNSNDMKFPAGLVLGIAPLVCDNLMFCGEVKVTRRHTLNIVQDIKSMITSSFDKLLMQGAVAG